MAEGYDLEGSPTFSVWQKLYRATEEPVTPSEAKPQAPSTSKKRRAGTEPASCQSHSTEKLLREILTFPTLEASGPPKCENIKRSIPDFVSGPESMQILLDEKPKKPRQLAENQKNLRERENRKEERREKQEEEKSNKEKRKKERADRKKKDQENSGSKRARKSDSQIQASRGKNGDRILWRMKKISVASASRSIFPLMAKVTLGSFAMVVTFGCI
ncbi:hypothetical protein AWC38_SpisGene8821 [Stylophora pistillata]|uniref:Uncharacterized protein n=1 Tax=Stylophora pistillata TaxID=50429 RepID=A0A2B4SD83_STYPI|nr:hypothetical protein AWC38_SpisGene8821 [Stylophora pistillata]